MSLVARHPDWGVCARLKRSQRNQYVEGRCLIFHQISKMLSTPSWFAAGTIFFNRVIHHFSGLFRGTRPIDGLLTCKRM